ncbi:MAG: SurA N-terminal domain-containing protein [Desulfobacteraceae bacterium]|nr:SurA N-terminal domain-containing protein [Desulfobacteraceae bacterium]
MVSGLKKSLSFICLTCFLVFILAGCRGDKAGEPHGLIATINGYELTREEYESKLARELDYTQEYKTTPEARAEFLDTLVQTEILIQEAMRLGLEKKPEFVRAIEKYWEATLIKNLMEEKNKDISQRTTVMDKDIKAYYDGLKYEDDTLPPLERIEPDIARQLKAEKQTQALNEWISEVKKKARVTIHQPNP